MQEAPNRNPDNQVPALTWTEQSRAMLASRFKEFLGP